MMWTRGTPPRAARTACSSFETSGRRQIGAVLLQHGFGLLDRQLPEQSPPAVLDVRTRMPWKVVR